MPARSGGGRAPLPGLSLLGRREYAPTVAVNASGHSFGKPGSRRARSACGAFGRSCRQIAPAVLTLTLFCLDALTDLRGEVAVLYVLSLLLVGTSTVRRTTIWAWSAACGLLTVTAFALVHGRDADVASIWRLAISLSANVVTTVLVLRANLIHAAMRTSEARYRTVFNDLAVGIWEHDFTPVQAAIAALRSQGVTDLRRYVAENPAFVVEARQMVRITDMNKTAMQMMNVPTREDFFSHLSDFLPARDDSFADCIVAIDERRPLFQAETVVQPRAGDPIDIIVMFSLAGGGPLSRVPGSVVDVSQRKRLEAQMTTTRAELEQVQRASALGAVSASIAHEINQPLAAIHSYSDAARRWLSHDPPALGEVRSALDGLGFAVEHARDVVQRVRALVGSAETVTRPIDLNGVVEEAIAFFRSDRAEDATQIVLDGDQMPVICDGDAVLLKHVMINLITNAIQAMAELPVSCRTVRLTVRQDGADASVMIEDNGPGWGTTAKDRAFQTFFTTKTDGMGLGLSICRATVEGHRGTIELGAARGGGACVLLTFPLSEPFRAAAPVRRHG